MRRLPLPAVILLISAFILNACGGGPGDPTQPKDQLAGGYAQGGENDRDEPCGEPTIVSLLAGQTIPVGEVIITNDETCLYVDFEVDEPWVLIDTHVEVVDDPANFPMTKTGNPKVGHFTYKAGECVDLSEWPCGTDLYIAAHAEVQKLDPTGEPVQAETAWGEGSDFPGNNWAMYCTHTVQCCSGDPDQETAWGEGPSFPGNSWAMYFNYTCGEPMDVRFIAGQTIHVGWIRVSCEDSTLHVEYDLTGLGWELVVGSEGVQTHLAVADSLDGIPQNSSGNPKVGQFPYKYQESFDVDISMYPEGTELFIAAHGVVQPI